MYNDKMNKRTSKTIISSAADVTFGAQTEILINKVKEEVTAIVKQTNCNPQKLLEYVQTSGTKVFKVNYADRLLSVIGEEEGFICAQEGFNALYLSIITCQGLKTQSEAMFVMREGTLEKYTMLHNFYRWYSMKSGLSGFDYVSREKFKKYLKNNSDEATKKLKLEDIVAIKEVIARDNEASEFVLDYTKSVEGSRNVMNKIKNEGGANI